MKYKIFPLLQLIVCNCLMTENYQQPDNYLVTWITLPCEGRRYELGDEGQ